MNERIRKLAEQAGMIIVDDKFSTYGKFAEKFAELIVKECAGIAHGSDTPSRDIKEHFGVE
jgi:hypothetical protein